MGEEISIAALRGRLDSDYDDVTIRQGELLALVEAVEAAHRVTTVGRDASHDIARAVYAEDLMHALDRFDFGRPPA